VVSHFEPAGAAALLEEEIREALVGTAGTAAGDPSGIFNLVSSYIHIKCLLTGLCKMTDADRLAQLIVIWMALSTPRVISDIHNCRRL